MTKPRSLLLLAAGAVATAGIAAATTSARTHVLPSTVTAAPITGASHGVLPRRALVGQGTLGVRVFVSQTRGFALADVQNVTYPAQTLDGGRTWRVNGPEFHLPAAQGPLVVTQAGAGAPKTYFAWGGPGGGNSVNVTTDGGVHWWRAFLGGSILAVVKGPRSLIATVQAPAPGGGNQAITGVYASRDGGKHWHLNRKFGTL